MQKRLSVRGSLAEIGVHHGKLLILLHLLARSDEGTVGWDLFLAQEENPDRSGRGDREATLRNLRRAGGDLERVSLIQANSLELSVDEARAALREPARLFSVDGGHTAECAYNDLGLALATAGEKGVIIVDDFFNPMWPGVAEGVTRFLREHPGALHAVCIGGNKVVFARPGAAAEYKGSEELQAALPFQWSTFFGAPVIIYDSRARRYVERWLRTSGVWRSERVRRAAHELNALTNRLIGS